MNADLMLNRPAVVALCCTRCIATACSCQHGKLPVTFSLPRMDVIPLPQKGFGLHGAMADSMGCVFSLDFYL